MCAHIREKYDLVMTAGLLKIVAREQDEELSCCLVPMYLIKSREPPGR